MALNRFSVLLFEPPPPKVSAEIKRTLYTTFYSFIFQLEVSHSAIESKVYYCLDITLYYFSKKERKQIDTPEVIGVAKGGGDIRPAPLIDMPPMIKRMTTKPAVYSTLVSFRIFEYNSNSSFFFSSSPAFP